MDSAPDKLAPLSREAFDRVLAEIDGEVPSGTMDCRATLERLDGDLELFRDLLGFYFRDVPELVGHIDRGLAANDADAVRRWAHRLKGLISNFDAVSACQSAFELEKMGRDGSLEAGRATFARLESQLAELSQWLRRF